MTFCSSTIPHHSSLISFLILIPPLLSLINTPQQKKQQKKPKPSAAALETRLQTAYTNSTERAPVTLKPIEVPIDLGSLAEWVTLLNTPTEFGLPLSSRRTEQTRTKFDTAMDLTNRGVAYLENVMPALVKANMAMKERLKSPASESMMTNSSPPPLSQYTADDGPLPCTSSLHFNDCSGTADDFASAPDRTTSETAMSLVKPLEDLTDEILSALCLCLQRKQCGCWARVIQANLASTKSR